MNGRIGVEDAPAGSGTRFWIDPDTGRVVRTVLAPRVSPGQDGPQVERHVETSHERVGSSA